MIEDRCIVSTNTTTVLRLSGFYPRVLGWASYQKGKTRKVKPTWIYWSKWYWR